MKLVTSYPAPDLDGTACLVAYAELLEKNGEEVIGAVFGEPDEEAKFLLEEFDVEITDASEYLEGAEVIVVDASFPDGISDQIDLEDVTEVIDHRKNHEADSFPNAEIDVQLVGAAATLIAERFRQAGKGISEESANLLYAAIKDNTVNFQANVTTKRDKEAAKWLEENAEIDKKLCQEIFKIKSEQKPDPTQIIPDDYYTTVHHGKKIGVSQIESLYTEKFVRENVEDIKEVLKDLKQKQDLDYAFLTCIDIESGQNFFVAADDQTSKLLSQALDLQFHNNLAQKEDMMLRKEVMPKVKNQIK